MFSYGRDINTVKIVYFSGTGNTAMIADCFEKAIVQRGLNVVKTQVTHENNYEIREDLLIIIYPVYAFNAPIPVLRWISRLQAVNNIPVVIISNSGGGEVTPNTASRVQCKNTLKKKGFDIVYEKTIVMPANWITPTPEPLAIKLLEVLPGNVEKIVNDLSNGIRLKLKPNFIDRIMPLVGKSEIRQAKNFGSKITLTQDCTGCGLCAKGCPSGNVKMLDSRPVFSDKCFFCTKCIYDCPKKALKTGIMKFALLKEGYSLKELEKKVPYTGEFDLDKLAKGAVLSGIKKYLLESGVTKDGKYMYSNNI